MTTHDSSMSGVPAQLLALEEQLLDPSVRKSPEALDELLADDFVEFGSSGMAHDKKQTIEALQEEPEIQRTLTDFQVRSLEVRLALVTYRAARTVGPERRPSFSLRSSLWRYERGRWRLAFHQGTPAKTP